MFVCLSLLTPSCLPSFPFYMLVCLPLITRTCLPHFLSRLSNASLPSLLTCLSTYRNTHLPSVSIFLTLLTPTCLPSFPSYMSVSLPLNTYQPSLFSFLAVCLPLNTYLHSPLPFLFVRLSVCFICTCLPSLSDDDDDDDVGLHVLGCRVDILGTNCNLPFFFLISLYTSYLFLHVAAPHPPPPTPLTVSPSPGLYQNYFALLPPLLHPPIPCIMPSSAGSTCLSWSHPGWATPAWSCWRTTASWVPSTCSVSWTSRSGTCGTSWRLSPRSAPASSPPSSTSSPLSPSGPTLFAVPASSSGTCWP